MPSGVNQQTVHIDSIKQHRHYPFSAMCRWTLSLWVPAPPAWLPPTS